MCAVGLIQILECLSGPLVVSFDSSYFTRLWTIISWKCLIWVIISWNKVVGYIFSQAFSQDRKIPISWENTCQGLQNFVGLGLQNPECKFFKACWLAFLFLERFHLICYLKVEWRMLHSWTVKITRMCDHFGWQCKKYGCDWILLSDVEMIPNNSVVLTLLPHQSGLCFTANLEAVTWSKLQRSKISV